MRDKINFQKVGSISAHNLRRAFDVKCLATLLVAGIYLFFPSLSEAQIGKRFPSERKVVKDAVTGTMLTFLTSTSAGDSKIYQRTSISFPCRENG